LKVLRSRSVLRPRVTTDGQGLVERTNLVDMTGWGAGCRLICRRERPHPGAQLSLFDSADGWRHTAFITNSPGDGVVLELPHRGHARVERHGTDATPQRADNTAQRNSDPPRPSPDHHHTT
jgi:hypothetical protein